ncbi:MAG: hypothetical protein NC241_07850 [Bacteroides sp.]|nr:hypothetical protein [Bacteroides sp.]MCM1457658.1 hypothetical protein [Lachnoclostridium sp.]
MSPNTDKENLRKLLSFLKEQILIEPRNRWFAEELYNSLASLSNTKIVDIYELCVEQIIKQQAEEYYSDFVIEDIRHCLIFDYIKMEHWRRRNNLAEFGMAVFQQIECIINRLGRDFSLGNVFSGMLGAPCYVDFMNPVVTNRSQKSTYQIGQLLFMTSATEKSKQLLASLAVMDKFKVINYFVCHQACLENSQFNQFISENDMFKNLYALRNKNHRGNTATDWEQAKLGDIEKNPSRSFLILTSFLNWFVESINKGFPLSNDLIEISKKQYAEVRNTAASGPKVVGKIDLSSIPKK